MDIPVGADVQCVDGPCGQSTHIVLKARTEEVTHLVVRERRFPHTEYLVPLTLVTESTPHLIRLRCTKDELEKQEPFLRTEFLEVDIPRYGGGQTMMRPYFAPEPGWLPVEYESVPPGELAVSRGSHVEATDGRVGQVDEFLVDPTTEHVTHLVLREGHLWGQKEITIPVSEIDRFREDTVYLKLDKRSIEALPAIPVRRRMA
jgi:sporulation protein YlmC with PRC-barrel domain